MTQHATVRQQSCRQCKRRRQRLRARSPLLNTLCAPVSRWGFTVLAVAGFYVGFTTAALIATALAVVAWRHN